MKILIPIAIVGLLAIQSCNNNKTGTDTSKSTDTTAMTNGMGKMDDAAMKNMDNAMMASMMTSMQKMNAVKMTGDFDAEYAEMMIPHHQGAIDMANLQLSKGTDEVLKKISRGIIQSQTAEINQFKTFLASHKENKIEGNHPELMEAMAGMDAKMGAAPLSGNVDKDFAVLMKIHHQGAVEMSQGLLGDGTDANLKKMATAIIAAQNKEIAEFSAWLASN